MPTSQKPDTLYFLKNEFPIFQNMDNQEKPFIYLDSAATSQKPTALTSALTYYYTHLNANVGRSSYDLAVSSDNAYIQSRKNISLFFDAEPHNTIFTSGATDSMNLCVSLLKQTFSTGKIVTSILEHHSNLLPLQRLCEETELELVYIEDIELLQHPEKINTEFWQDVKIIALTHVSNTTGLIIPIQKWSDIANQHNIVSIFDGSQGVTTQEISIKSLGCDFYYFSAHKMYGPMGLGILFISDKFLSHKPHKLGGGIVDSVHKHSYSLIDGVARFEAGTPNVAGAYAFSKVLKFFKPHWKEVLHFQESISEYLFSNFFGLSSKEYIVDILDGERRLHFPSEYSHLISFIVRHKDPSMRGLHTHDIGEYLSSKGICVRTGLHCAHPLHEYYSAYGTTRISLGVYNTRKDIDFTLLTLIACLNDFEKI